MANAAAGNPRSALRIPLGARVLGVLLVGIALAAIPGYLVIRWATERAVLRTAFGELSAQADVVARGLAGASEEEV